MGADAPTIHPTASASAPAPPLDRLLRDAPLADPAVIDATIRLSSAEVASSAAALAGAWQAGGLRRGDVVAWQLPNWHEAVVCFRACWMLGAVAAPLHHRGGEQEVARQLGLLAPHLVLGAPGLPSTASPGAIEVRGDGGYEALLHHPPMRSGEAGPGDGAVVLFTSGSSTAPKGVVHTHRSLGHKARTMLDVHGLGPSDVVLMPAPMAHVSGLLNGVLLPAVAGMTVVFVEHWDPAEALALIAAERVSFMVGPPTYFLGLLEEPGFTPDLVASLRVVSCGGTGVTPAFVERASAGLGARVKRSYGSTEAPTVTTWHAGDPPGRAATTDGRPVGDVELRVTDSSTGRTLGAGQVGELWVRGSELFAGYLGDDPPPDGDWFRTGDLATVDQEGWMTVVGRTHDVIIRGGENISPGEVESVLEAHPTIRRALVVGLPDERLGEIVAAAVVADGEVGLAACRAWFAERGVARFKVPERLRQVAELPLLASGKPDRRAVRDLLLSEP